jgi:serine/threonine protein kinase
MADWIGRTLGRVKIESLVARGGIAEIYLGTHVTLQREVAVKILRNSFEDDPRTRERFEREARAVAKLRHPNIVQVFDFATIDDQPYIVMEFMRGPSLSKYLSALHARNNRMELPLVGRLLSGVASALQYAHESGVIHRDVKPGNILLTSRASQILPGQTLPLDFEPVLTDFGLVRILNSSRQTTLGQTAGTPAYMSPEQALGLATDGRTDIYSLGIVLYEMLNGDVPFDGETTMSVLLKHLNEAPPPIPGLPPPLQEVLDRALAKTVDDRFENPKEFAEAFNAALQDTSGASTVLPAKPVTRPTNTPTKRQEPVSPASKPRSYWRAALLAGALIALVSLAAFFKGAFPAAATETPTATLSDTPALAPTVSLGPTGVLQFHDGTGVLDRATLIADAMPAPPAGSQYEVWLVSGGERLSLGILSVDGEGRGSLIFDNPQAKNLLATYNGVEVTTNAGTSSDTDGQRIAYFYALPEEGLVYLRDLMVSFSSTPEQIGLIHGLAESTKQLEQAAGEMLGQYGSGDEAGTRKSAEAMLNLLSGDLSPDYKDWDGDKQITDPSNGYGLLLNGHHLGYIRAVYSHADYAVNAAGSSRNIIVNGENLKICTQSLARWTPQLRDQLLAILNASTLSDMDLAVKGSAALADQMLNGIDRDEDGTIETVAEECGVNAAYEATYRMADMPLLPVNPFDTPTVVVGLGTPSQMATPTPRSITATSTRGLTGVTNVPPTNQPPPQATRKPKPTRRPRPTRNPHNS